MEPNNISDVFFSYENPLIYAITFIIIVIGLIILIKREFIGPLSVAKRKLELENIKLSALFSEIDPDPIFRVDSDSKIIDMNNSAREVFKNPDVIKDSINTLMRDNKSDKETKILKSEITIENKCYTYIIKNIQELGYKHIYFHDITSRVEYEQKINDYQSNLKELSRKIDSTNEEEKQRIGKELHDGVGHSLSLLKMEMQNYFIKKDIDVENNEVSKLMSSVDDLSDEVRELAHQLKPRILGEFGLVQALKSLVDKTNVQGKIRGYVSQSGDFSIKDESHERNIYRICQEALNNIIKHSDCSEFSVDLVFRNKELKIIISDDGKGFAIDKKMNSRNSSLGLLNMKERAESIDGTLIVDSIKDMGTSIYLTVNVME